MPRTSRNSKAATSKAAAKTDDRVFHMGPFFRRMRIEAGVSEEAVARYLGNVSVDMLRQYEAGRRSIPLNHIYALTNCLNLSPELVIGMVNKLYRA